MTTEEKAKAYDEALERAKKWYNAPNIDKMPTYGNRIIEEIFPELEESEDERIRKELINYLITDEDNGVPKVGQIPIDNVITWLEKQNPIMAKSPQLGEQKSANNNELKFKVGDWVVENGVNGNPVQITFFEEDKGVGIKVWFSNGTGTWVDYLKGYHKWTIKDAKDGDVLITVDDKYPFIYKGCLDPNHPGLPVAYCGIDSEGYFTVSSVGNSNSWWSDEKVQPATKAQRDNFYIKMKESKYEWDAEKKELKKIKHESIDKVESKFKTGEWVVTSYGKVNQVIAVDEDGDGFTLDDNTYFSGSWKDDYHLWSINDAKDGDVLAEDSCIFIIKKMNPNGTAKVHCCLFDDGEFDLTSQALGFVVDSAHPATKEQRDLLFKKIKEEGYEWDTEKKELKKIEQKPTAWNGEDNTYYDDICEILINLIHSETAKVNKDVVQKDLDWLMSIQQRIETK